MIKVNCICGHKFHAYPKVIEVGVEADFDIEEFKEEIYQARSNQIVHGATLNVPLDQVAAYSYERDHQELDAKCPVCGTVTPVIIKAYVDEDSEMVVTKHIADKLAPVYRAPVPHYGYQQQLGENYVYNAALTRANGRPTAQCTVTKKLKFL